MPRPQPYRAPDGHSWRDPDLPVFGKSGKAIDYHKMELGAQIGMHNDNYPTWRDDPTYNLRRTNAKPNHKS